MKEIKPRADFEVYLKKFLQSLDLILPNAAAHPYRGPGAAVRLSAAHGQGALQGRLARHLRRRRKGAALINEHLIDLGINPKIPPVELLSTRVHRARATSTAGDPKAKASEMEHAIRKHCTVHFDEDPAFYKRLSEKLEKLIQEHRDNWQALADGYEQLRTRSLRRPDGDRRGTDEGGHDFLRLRGLQLGL